jgi:serine/threonine protein kinase
MIENSSPTAKLTLVDFGSCACETFLEENLGENSILPLKQRAIIGTTCYCPPEICIGIYNE